MPNPMLGSVALPASRLLQQPTNTPSHPRQHTSPTRRIDHLVESARIVATRIYNVAMATAFFLLAAATLNNWAYGREKNREYWERQNSDHSSLKAHLWGIVNPVSFELEQQVPPVVSSTTTFTNSTLASAIAPKPPSAIPESASTRKTSIASLAQQASTRPQNVSETTVPSLNRRSTASVRVSEASTSPAIQPLTIPPQRFSEVTDSSESLQVFDETAEDDERPEHESLFEESVLVPVSDATLDNISTLDDGISDNPETELDITEEEAAATSEEAADVIFAEAPPTAGWLAKTRHTCSRICAVAARPVVGIVNIMPGPRQVYNGVGAVTRSIWNLATFGPRMIFRPLTQRFAQIDHSVALSTEIKKDLAEAKTELFTLLCTTIYDAEASKHAKGMLENALDVFLQEGERAAERDIDHLLKSQGKSVEQVQAELPKLKTEARKTLERSASEEIMRFLEAGWEQALKNFYEGTLYLDLHNDNNNLAVTPPERRLKNEQVKLLKQFQMQIWMEKAKDAGLVAPQEGSIKDKVDALRSFYEDLDGDIKDYAKLITRFSRPEVTEAVTAFKDIMADFRGAGWNHLLKARVRWGREERERKDWLTVFLDFDRQAKKKAEQLVGYEKVVTEEFWNCYADMKSRFVRSLLDHLIRLNRTISNVEPQLRTHPGERGRFDSILSSNTYGFSSWAKESAMEMTINEFAPVGSPLRADVNARSLGAILSRREAQHIFGGTALTRRQIQEQIIDGLGELDPLRAYFSGLSNPDLQIIREATHKVRITMDAIISNTNFIPEIALVRQCLQNSDVLDYGHVANVVQQQRGFGTVLRDATNELVRYEPRSWYKRYKKPFVIPPAARRRRVSNELAAPPKRTHNAGNWKTWAAVSNVADQVPGWTAAGVAANEVFSDKTLGDLTTAAYDFAGALKNITVTAYETGQPLADVAKVALNLVNPTGVATAVATGAYVVAPPLRSLLAYSTAALYLVNKTGYTAVPIPDAVGAMAITHIARHRAADVFDWLGVQGAKWMHYAKKSPGRVLTKTVVATAAVLGTGAAIYNYGLPSVATIQSTLATLQKTAIAVRNLDMATLQNLTQGLLNSTLDMATLKNLTQGFLNKTFA